MAQTIIHTNLIYNHKTVKHIGRQKQYTMTRHEHPMTEALGRENRDMNIEKTYCKNPATSYDFSRKLSS